MSSTRTFTEHWWANRPTLPRRHHQRLFLLLGTPQRTVTTLPLESSGLKILLSLTLQLLTVPVPSFETFGYTAEKRLDLWMLMFTETRFHCRRSRRRLGWKYPSSVFWSLFTWQRCEKYVFLSPFLESVHILYNKTMNYEWQTAVKIQNIYSKWRL